MVLLIPCNLFFGPYNILAIFFASEDPFSKWLLFCFGEMKDHENDGNTFHCLITKKRFKQLQKRKEE